MAKRQKKAEKRSDLKYFPMDPNYFPPPSPHTGKCNSIHLCDDLETTVKFIKAKEDGKKDGDYLDGLEMNMNKITSYGQQQREQLEAEKS